MLFGEGGPMMLGKYFLPPKNKNNPNQPLNYRTLENIYLDQKKYQKANVLTGFAIKRFFKSLAKVIQGGHYKSVLDVGCGEGVPLLNILSELQSNNSINGVDFDEIKLLMIKNNIPQGNFVKGNIYNLPYKSKTFDLILCLEVLEHLSSPKKALEEIQRVSSQDILFSVPNEPLWSFLNVVCLKYIRNCFNTPGHCQKWSSYNFQNLVKKYFKIKLVKKVIPWTAIFCSKEKTL
jgi:ubiquinone/menaquinone biosynthesis C-methylase UbiE